MGLWELIVLAVGVSMDAFAVSVCKGLAMPKVKLRHGLICGAWFGGFQALMPLLGFYLGSLFAGGFDINDYDHWVAFGLLAIIGINTLREALKSGCCDCEDHNADLSFKTMFVMAVATSIDALAVGVSLAMEDVNIFLAIGLIGATTFMFCTAGVKIGNIFGCKFEKPAQIAGGVILILLGLKILLEGLGILVF